MGEVVEFTPKKEEKPSWVVTKIIDGKAVDYFDVDRMPIDERLNFMATHSMDSPSR